MFPRRREPDEDHDAGFPDDQRNWRSDADEQRRTAELLRMTQQATQTYQAMAKVWDAIQQGWQRDRNRMKWVDTRTGKIIEP